MYLDFLETGTKASIRAASVAVSAALFLIVALPILAVATRIVAV